MIKREEIPGTEQTQAATSRVEPENEEMTEEHEWPGVKGRWI